MPATSSVFLNVHDLDRSIEFYRKLGFRVDKTWKNDEGVASWADLSLQGAELGLGRIGSNDDPEFRAWVSTPLGAGVIVYFTVPTVARYWKLAQDSGATVEAPLTERPYGTMFTVNDPDGYTITILQEPRRTRASGAAKKRAAASKKTAAKKTSRKTAKTTAKKALSKKGAGKKGAGKNAAGKKAAKKTATRKTATKKAGARKAAAKRPGAKKGARRG